MTSEQHAYYSDSNAVTFHRIFFLLLLVFFFSGKCIRLRQKFWQFLGL